ncbi:hypothetical protein BC833DRAFT_605476 [Globomyces pollinis-pini]|nr:hypothetical protein BC833DRAFT_605476 [Globomyces pollinis-pini]
MTMQSTLSQFQNTEMINDASRRKQFSPSQVKELENYYSNNSNPTSEQCRAVGESLTPTLTGTQVSNWFRRRKRRDTDATNNPTAYPLQNQLNTISQQQMHSFALSQQNYLSNGYPFYLAPYSSNSFNDNNLLMSQLLAPNGSINMGSNGLQNGSIISDESVSELSADTQSNSVSDNFALNDVKMNMNNAFTANTSNFMALPNLHNSTSLSLPKNEIGVYPPSTMTNFIHQNSKMVVDQSVDSPPSIQDSTDETNSKVETVTKDKDTKPLSVQIRELLNGKDCLYDQSQVKPFARIMNECKTEVERQYMCDIILRSDDQIRFAFTRTKGLAIINLWSSEKFIPLKSEGFTLKMLKVIEKLPFDYQIFKKLQLGKFVKKELKSESKESVALAQKIFDEWTRLTAIQAKAKEDKEKADKLTLESNKRPRANSIDAIPKKQKIEEKKTAVVNMDLFKSLSTPAVQPKARSAFIPAPKKSAPSSQGTPLSNLLDHAFESASRKSSLDETASIPDEPKPSTSLGKDGKKKKSVRFRETITETRYFNIEDIIRPPLDSRTKRLQELETLTWTVPKRKIVSIFNSFKGVAGLKFPKVISKESDIQEAREKTTLSVIYIHLKDIPYSPAEPQVVEANSNVQPISWPFGKVVAPIIDIPSNLMNSLLSLSNKGVIPSVQPQPVASAISALQSILGGAQKSYVPTTAYTIPQTNSPPKQQSMYAQNPSYKPNYNSTYPPPQYNTAQQYPNTTYPPVSTPKPDGYRPQSRKWN